MPLITLRDMIIFLRTVKPFIVGRPASLAAVDAALSGDRRIFLSCRGIRKPRNPAPESSSGSVSWPGWSNPSPRPTAT